MRTTISLTVSTKIVAGIAFSSLLAAATGCATVSSNDLPWRQPAGEDGPSAESTAPTSDESDDEGVEQAAYWAKQAISASHQIAYARQLRRGTERDTGAVVDRDADGSQKTSHSTNHADASPRSETGSKQSTSGEDGSETSPSDSSTVSGNSTTTTASANRNPDFRTVERREQIANSDRRADGWPVGLPDSSSETDGSPHDPVDPTIDRRVYDLTDESDRQAFSEISELDPSELDGKLAIPGTYLKPETFEQFEDPEFRGFDHLSEEQKHNQIAIITPGKRVEVYAGTEQFAAIDFDTQVDMPSKLATVEPVRIVDEETTQLLCYWPETSGDGKTVRYKAGVLKVIGPFVGKLFEETVARRPAPEESEDQDGKQDKKAERDLKRTKQVEILRGKSKPLIRVTPIDSSGEPAVDGAQILEWNPWEGVFRVPKPPPTAPDQTS